MGDGRGGGFTIIAASVVMTLIGLELVELPLLLDVPAAALAISSVLVVFAPLVRTSIKILLAPLVEPEAFACVVRVVVNDELLAVVGNGGGGGKLEDVEINIGGGRLRR